MNVISIKEELIFASRLMKMQIATAAIIERKGKYLVAKRKAGGVVGGKWEFPGGKLEQDESLHQGLIREIDEELCIKVQVGEFFDEHVHRYKSGPIKLYAYIVSHYSGKIQLREHDEFRWVNACELQKMDFIGNDRPIISKLAGRSNKAFGPLGKARALDI